MIKTYILQGLCCPNCAAKIESAVQKLEGVSAASVSFINTTLKVEWTDIGESTADKLIIETVHRYEPDVIIIEQTQEKKTEKDIKSLWPIAGLIIGSVIFGIALFLRFFISNIGYIPLAIFILSYLILGMEVILRAIKTILHGQVFDENFLMSVATIGAFAIGEYPEAVAVMLFYRIGIYLESLAVRKSKKSIADLMNIRPDYANLKKDGEINRVSPNTINIGDIIIVKPGEKIPLDGTVIDGESLLDTSSLTGESVPRKVSASDPVLSGCINLNSMLTVEVTKTFEESTVVKMIDLVENAANRKAKTENFITVFSRYYTPVVVILAALLAVIPPFFTGTWSEWIHRGLIFLVISCPCALVISIPLGYFAGIGQASKKGIFIKGGNYLEAIGNLDIVVFDKTGTLTKGVFKVTNILPADNITKDEVLELAAIAETFSNHPIALSIQQAYGKNTNENVLSEYEEIVGHGVRAKIDNTVIWVGNHRLMEQNNVKYIESSDIGTKVYVAAGKRYLGCIVISDEIRPDSHKTITELKAKGIRKTAMLTGDSQSVAEAVAVELALDEFCAGLLPAQKVEKVELIASEKRPGRKFAFLGDGINDAPVLALADVGVAMGGLGSDAAIEAADVVLMTDEPSKLLEAVDIAHFTKHIVWQNIIFALSVKIVFMLLGAFGIANLWEAVFADVGVTVLAVLNAARIVKSK
ncbi:MAG: cadmium-translocating P-type ATPase [Clostridiales bacterium]|jgi:Cd2+/Zn2+-exporting ATPase|nr:cadmium-translocating P-type ATPase [Clostridiales bacterium]